MSAEELPIAAEPIVEPAGVSAEVTSSWPGFVQIETGLGDMRSLLGKEAYDRQIRLVKAIDPDGRQLRRRMGGMGIHGAVGPNY